MSDISKLQDMFSGMTKTMESQFKPEPIIMINDEIAFKRSEFKRAKQVKDGSNTNVEIYFTDGSKEVASNMKLQEILQKIK